MTRIGHNQPPDMIGTVVTTTADLSAWLSENPVIENDTQAKEMKLWLDRGFLAIKDAEDERTAQTKPLNDKLRHINQQYKEPESLLRRVLNVAKQRLDKYIKIQEEARRAKAEQAERIAREAELAAREAERLERDAIGDARLGALDVDVAGLAAARQSAEAAAQKAGRQAAIAEREAHVKIKGMGHIRAASLREYEVVTVTDAIALIRDVGVPHDVEEALRRVAKAFRKVHGRWPAGVDVHIERKS